MPTTTTKAKAARKRRTTGDTTAIYPVGQTCLSGGAWPARLPVAWLLKRQLAIVSVYLPHARERAKTMPVYAGIALLYQDELTALRLNC